MARLQAEASAPRESDPPRDSFGSFVDTHNPRATRRFSTVGLHPVARSSIPPSRPSIPPSRPSVKPLASTGNRPSIAPVSRPSVAPLSRPSVAPLSRPSMAPLSSAVGRPSVASKPEPVKRPYTAISTAHQPSRRISLLERSYMATVSRAATHPTSSSTTTHAANTTGTTTDTMRTTTSTVSGGMVVGSARLNPRPRRASLLGRPGSAEKEKPEQEEVKVTVSPSKKRRYTMAVSRPVPEPEVHPSYTYTPSSDRRVTLDFLLMKSGRIQSDSDSSVNSSLNKCGWWREE